MKVPVSKLKLKEQVQESDEDEIDDEFTEEELRSLFPASELLNKIYSDHVYTASRNDIQSKPENDCVKGVSKILESTSKSTVTNVGSTVINEDTQKSNVPNKLLHPFKVQMFHPNLNTTKSPPSTQKMPVKTRHTYKRPDIDISTSLNAESIQKVFLNMINMTSLSPIVDSNLCVEKGLDRVPGRQTSVAPTNASATKGTVDMEEAKRELDDKEASKSAAQDPGGNERPTDTNSSRRQNNADEKRAIIKRKNYAVQRKSRTSSLNYDSKSLTTGNTNNDSSDSTFTPSGSKSQDGLKPGFGKGQKTETMSNTSLDNTPKACKNKDTVVQQSAVDQQSLQYKAVVQEVNALLQATTNLLARRWGEYLHMTTVEVNEFAIKDARDAGVVEEVVEMLEDTDRYVWKLVDELTFY